MKILIIHQENRYFGGAEVLLGQFLEGLAASGADTFVAVVPGSRFAELTPQTVTSVPIADNTRFSPWRFLRQAHAILSAHRVHRFELIHGWAARDWELTALTGWLAKKPTLGLLHDHPRAPFIPGKRQILMRTASRILTKVACVSHAVEKACLESRYDPSKLVVIHNGIRMLKNEALKKTTSPVRFGFLGVFAERKGLRDLFEMMSMLARKSEIPWELHLAGDAQDATGRALIDEIRIQYGDKTWWGRVFWRGWVRRPQDFLRDIDLLICPSSDFEPCPLVVCEAGAMGLAVLGARTGGIPEIIADGKTGWLYDPGDLRGGAEFLVKALIQPAILAEMGAAALLRVESEFNLTKMVAEYRNIYSNLIRNVW